VLNLHQLQLNRKCHADRALEHEFATVERQ